MRIKLKITFNNLTLPINYNNIIQGFIYNNISDDSFRNFLHNKGFKYKGRKFKLFTFSRLQGIYKINKKQNTISFKSPVYLTVSSLVDEFVNDFGNTLLNEKDLYLGKNKVFIETIQTQNKQIDKDNIRIEMSSPVVTYSTVDLHGHKKTIYHRPGEELFDKLIHENLKKKYSIVYGEEIEKSSFHIVPKRTKPVITKYKGFIIKGWLGELELKGDRELIQLAYEVGLGSKNSQGFGCFKIKE